MSASSNDSQSTRAVAKNKMNTVNMNVVPIVFVPGIMGSRLHLTETDSYWDPDSTSRMLHWVFADWDDQVREMDYRRPAVVVDDPNDNPAGYSAERVERGWNEVLERSYGTILPDLENSANLGVQGYRCPVYAIGYDWRLSIKDCHTRITERIQNDILPDEDAEKVILVTHSMGGLVTRWAMMNGLESSVLGVVHCVQPAFGATIFYSRCRIGADDAGAPLSWIMGNTAGKFSALMSGLPGGVQLIAAPLYNQMLQFTNRDHWLQYRPGTNRPPTGWFSGDGDWEQTPLQPWQGSVWDAYRETTGNPGVINHSEYNTASPNLDLPAVRSELMATIGKAEEFHAALGDYKHPNTFALYGNVPHDPNEDPGTVVGADVHFPVAFDDDEDNATPIMGRGDTTVPAGSGRGLFGDQRNGDRQYSIDAISHEPCFKTAAFSNQVFACIRAILGNDPLAQRPADHDQFDDSAPDDSVAEIDT
jgi:hypothetical protein